jgi:predicted phosphohydrolase
MLSVKLLSDIHLEKMKSYPGLSHFIIEERNIDIICLCGDIGDPREESYKMFLTDCAKKCNMHTFVVMGNHEMYGKTIKETSSIINNICKNINIDLGDNKIIFLDQGSFDVQNIRFLGTTLWSDIDPQEAWNIRCCINDFRAIISWGISQHNYAFSKSVQWLQSSIEKAKADNKKVVVMTHYVPVMNVGNPQFVSSPLKSAFASDLYDFIKKYKDLILYWFYGHNHYSESTIIADTTCVVSNQMGYQKETNKFNKDHIINI